MKPKRYDLADWLILALHWGLGALAGTGGMLRVLDKHAAQPAWLLWGGACLFGGFTGLVQNRHWNRDTYRVIPPEEAQHIGWSKGLMIGSIALGACLILGGFVGWFV